MAGVLAYRGMKKVREGELSDGKNCGMFLLDGGDLLKQLLSVKKYQHFSFSVPHSQHIIYK